MAQALRSHLHDHAQQTHQAQNAGILHPSPSPSIPCTLASLQCSACGLLCSTACVMQGADAVLPCRPQTCQTCRLWCVPCDWHMTPVIALNVVRHDKPPHRNNALCRECTGWPQG